MPPTQSFSEETIVQKASVILGCIVSGWTLQDAAVIASIFSYCCGAIFALVSTYKLLKKHRR